MRLDERAFNFDWQIADAGVEQTLIGDETPFESRRHARNCSSRSARGARLVSEKRRQRSGSAAAGKSEFEFSYCLLKTIVESVVPRGLSAWRTIVSVLPSADKDSLSVVVALKSLPLKLPARIDVSSSVFASNVAFLVLVPPIWPPPSVVTSLPSSV